MAFAKNTQARVVILARDTTGALKSGATLTAQVSLDGGAYTNTTNAPTEIGSTGTYSLTLTSSEMNADVVSVRWSGTGVVADALVAYTEGNWTSSRAGYVDRINTALPNAAPGSNGGLPTADSANRVAGVAAAVTAGTVSDKTGYSLAADQSGATIGTVNALGTAAAATVNAQADQALADYDPPTKSELDSATANLDVAVSTRAPSATALANVTWTDGRAAKLDNLDLAVSSRGTADPGDEMALAPGAVAGVVAAVLGGSVAFADGGAATVADCLVAARTQGAGDWSLAGTTLTMTGPDGGTQYRFTLTLDGQGNPTARELQ